MWLSSITKYEVHDFTGLSFSFFCAKWKLECVCVAARCTTRKVYYDGMTECDFCVVMSEVLLPVKCIML